MIRQTGATTAYNVRHRHEENSSSSHSKAASSSHGRRNSLLRRESNPWAHESDDDRHATVTPRGRRRSATPPAVSEFLDFHDSSQKTTNHPRPESWTQLRREKAPSPTSDSLSNLAESGSERDSVSSSEEHPGHAEVLGRKALIHEVRRLRKKLASLQQWEPDEPEVHTASSTSSKWTILYEVACLGNSRATYYIDDRELEHRHWQGQRQVTNVSSWIRRQKTPFLISRMYSCVHQREQPLGPSEKLVIYSNELDDVIRTWLRSSNGMSIYELHRVYAHKELSAPYTWFFHFGHEAKQMLSDAETPSPDASSLLEYLHTATVAIAKDANDSFGAGKVTAELMPYLFKPGAVVCFEQSGNLIACEQASVLTMSHEDMTLHRKTYECSTSSIAFDGSFRYLAPTVRRITVELPYGQSMNIEDLSVQPLAYISSERRLSLERRGEIFMRCEQQLYVTYPNEGGHHDFVRPRSAVYDDRSPFGLIAV
jgi:hypothetical protein